MRRLIEERRQAEIRASQRAAEISRQLQAASTTQAAAVNDIGGVSTPDPGISVPLPAPSTVGEAAANIALGQLGTPYVWGGAAPGGFDCSGLVMWAYSQVGVSLPHSTYAQYSMGVPVSRDQLQPGDIVFFDGLGHEGLYIGGGQFVHAPHTGDVVKISSLSDSWYASSYVGARRIL